MPALRGYRVSSRSAITNSKQLLLERAKQKRTNNLNNTSDYFNERCIPNSKHSYLGIEPSTIASIFYSQKKGSC
jgi:hypothetical protein